MGGEITCNGDSKKDFTIRILRMLACMLQRENRVTDVRPHWVGQTAEWTQTKRDLVNWKTDLKNSLKIQQRKTKR